LKASTWIASFLAKQETPAVFHLSGGMTTFIIDAIATLGVTPIINMRHEQAAGFAKALELEPKYFWLLSANEILQSDSISNLFQLLKNGGAVGLVDRCM